jgi:ribosomal protein S18 acetylase RimI-like enzyme
MVAYAIEECRKRGIQFLRLDTRWDNKKLCDLYESMGFVIVGKIQVGDRALALLEMKID